MEQAASFLEQAADTLEPDLIVQAAETIPVTLSLISRAGKAYTTQWAPPLQEALTELHSALIKVDMIMRRMQDEAARLTGGTR